MTEYMDKVLIVDDVSAMRQLLGNVLGQLGYRNVFMVGTGEEAIERIKKEKFSVVMLDIDLPGISGLDTLAKLRAIRSDLFVVMISAHHSARNVKEAIANGTDGFIAKPCQRKKIDEVLQKYRRRGRKTVPAVEIDW